MRGLAVTLAFGLTACGLGLTGLATSEAGGDGGTTDASLPPSGGDGASPVDGATPADAGDSAGPPDPTKVTVSYAIGKNQIVYAFDVVAKTFKALPSAGCPGGEETAVMSDGTVYVTSSDNSELFRLDAAGCTSIKASGSFPYALGTAPPGTLAATEELVGYTGGDYVRVNRTTGAVTTIVAGALGGYRPSGDVTAIGDKGYLAAISGTGPCPSGGDCIVEVNLTSGSPVQLVAHLANYSITGIAHSKGQLLLYANGAVYPFDLGTKTVGASLANFPSGASFSGAGAPPFQPP